MNNKLSDALSEIRDEYIDSAANARPGSAGKWAWAAAAALALVIAGGALVHGWQKPPVSLEQPGTNATEPAPQPTEPAPQPTEPIVQPTQPITPPSGGAKIYWARSAGGFTPVAKPGKVTIDSYLEKAMDISTNSKDLFAVSLEVDTEVSKEVLYKEFVLPIGAKEEFMEKGVVYLTKAQIEKLECPEGMSVVLNLAVQYDVCVIECGECMVSEDYFDKLCVDTVDLWIVFRPTGTTCDGTSRTESCIYDAYKNEFLSDYGISDEAWDYMVHYYRHEAILWGVDAKLASKMLHDPRIDEMWNSYTLRLPPHNHDLPVYWEEQTE